MNPEDSGLITHCLLVIINLTHTICCYLHFKQINVRKASEQRPVNLSSALKKPLTLSLAHT